MKVLGYNGGVEGYLAAFGTGHDSSASIVVDGQIVAAVEEERFNREKHSSKFPIQAMQYCLKEGGVERFEDLDLVTYYWSYPLMFDQEILKQNKGSMGLLDKVGTWGVLTALRTFNKGAGYDNEKTWKQFCKHTGADFPLEKFQSVPHHLCHAASTYYDSPYDEALVYTIDGSGESSSSLAAVYKGTEYELLDEVVLPNSLGLLYLWLTDYLGFQPANDEYKVMGLAPYGDGDKYKGFFEEFITWTDEGKYELDHSATIKLVAASSKEGVKVFPPRFAKALGPRRKKGEPIEQRHMDIAASLQRMLEKTVMRRLEYLQKQTGQKNLCMAGGVALNSTMNGKIAASGLFDNVWIHTAAHDAGTSVGGALHGYFNLLNQPRVKQKSRQRYLGPSWTYDKVEEALTEYDDKIEHQKFSNGELYKEVAKHMANGKVIGWYQGRMEWGPRALGNRSIIADPRRDDMKDIVNHAVKLREGFRPFAPSTLAETAHEWFDLSGLHNDSPYMLFVVPVVEDKREKIPAVTHVDGSARVQTVREEDNPRYHALIKAFYEQTGVPVILNTSFNIKGEPIVNTPADAVRCFLGTGIDMLVLEDVLIEKRPEVVKEIEERNSRAKWETGRVGKDGRIEGHI